MRKLCDMRLRDWYLTHFVPLFQADARPRTIESYLTTITMWELHTPNPPLDDLSPILMAEFRSRLAGSAATVAKHCRQLNAILTKLGPPGPHNRDALGLLNQSPWCKPPRAPVRIRPIPTDADLDAFMHYAPPDLQLFTVTAATTGARQTAVRGLTAFHIDPQAQIIRYTAECDKRRQERLKPIPQLLITWWRLYGHLADRWKSTRWWFSARWRRTTTRAHTPQLKPHGLKRWWAARLIRQGASPWCVKFALDHAQRDVTGIHYLQPFDELAGLVDKIPWPASFTRIDHHGNGPHLFPQPQQTPHETSTLLPHDSEPNQPTEL